MEIDINPLFTVYVYSHFFKITKIERKAVGMILKFCSKYILMGYARQKNGKPKLVPMKVFASKVGDYDEFRFHIGQYSDFLHMLNLNYVTEDMYHVKFIPMYKPVSINVTLNKNIILRDYQEEAQNFILNNDPNDNRSRLVSLKTGLGKGITSLSSVSKLKTRVMVIILPSYIDKWCKEITEVLDVKPKEVMPVQGSSQLKGLIDLANNNSLTAKFIVISLPTIKNFFKTYETYGALHTRDEYGCIPEDLCELTGVGAMIIDEVHQHLHGVFKALLYTNVPKVIALSATFISNDHQITNIQKMMFPKEIRFDKIVMENYTKVRVVSYSFEKYIKELIRTTQFKSNTYSHVEFEKSIIRNKKYLYNYLRLIDSLVKSGYIANYIKGDKLAIYAASIEMCNRITEYLKMIYKHLDIRRYVENDPYENVIDSDIRVSTILSSGTAIDIPGLRVVIMTTNIDSPVSNLQTLGRLRKLKDRDVIFYYIYCENIPKQVEYHKKKMDLFQDHVVSIKELKSNVYI